MILFKPEHVPMILDGTKTQTRRLGKKRWNVGAVHQARTKLFGEPFAGLRITGVRRQVLCEITYPEALAEGYQSINEYLDAFCRINGTPRSFDVVNQEVWVVDFERVQEDS